VGRQAYFFFQFLLTNIELRYLFKTPKICLGQHFALLICQFSTKNATGLA
jgi:hypothetical protein